MSTHRQHNLKCRRLCYTFWWLRLWCLSPNASTFQSFAPLWDPVHTFHCNPFLFEMSRGNAFHNHHFSWVCDQFLVVMESSSMWWSVPFSVLTIDFRPQLFFRFKLELIIVWRDVFIFIFFLFFGSLSMKTVLKHCLNWSQS